MKVRLSFLLSLTLVVLVTVGCQQAPLATAGPQSPSATSTEAVEPTRTPVTEPASAGELPDLIGSLHLLGHASFRLDGPPVIYIDPTTLGAEPPPAAIILISHDHQDHFSLPVLKQISKPETVIITNQRVADKLESVEGEVRVLQPGEQTTVGEVEVETVPAYNIDKSFHPKTAGNLGFIVTLGGERLYFAGDTDHIPEMADIQCDVALLPIGGTYTMDVQEAAAAAADIGPRVAVPMHARSADPEEFRELCECEVIILQAGQ
jgi:L-ascorbate metabolism protein UlaG (beta-lactamase superfamily)